MDDGGKGEEAKVRSSSTKHCHAWRYSYTLPRNDRFTVVDMRTEIKAFRQTKSLLPERV